MAELWMNNKYNQNHYLFCSIQSFMFKYKIYSNLQQRNTSAGTFVYLSKGVLYNLTVNSNLIVLNFNVDDVTCPPES